MSLALVPLRTHESDRDLLRRRIVERSRDFDIRALLDLLKSQLGYCDEHIVFTSDLSQSHRASLVQKVEFLDGVASAPDLVRITVNLGLLSAQSALPSFFFQRNTQLEDPVLSDTIRYFDHLLLRERFRGLYPELDEELFPGWNSTAYERIRLLRPECPATLHWIFTHAYPEADVCVRRVEGERDLATAAVRLGESQLGGPSTLGGLTQVGSAKIAVTLVVIEEHTELGRDWASEAAERLWELVMPLVAPTDLDFTVELDILESASEARVSRSHLGYEPLAEAAPGLRRVSLFDGPVSRWRQSVRALQDPKALDENEGAV